MGELPLANIEKWEMRAVLKKAQTAGVIYTPPQHPQDIERLTDNLVQYINDDQLCSADPLVKMAIIHHQFESIHPFGDGNGRVGRILMNFILIKNSFSSIINREL